MNAQTPPQPTQPEPAPQADAAVPPHVASKHPAAAVHKAPKSKSDAPKGPALAIFFAVVFVAGLAAVAYLAYTKSK